MKVDFSKCIEFVMKRNLFCMTDSKYDKMFKKLKGVLYEFMCIWSQ